MSEQSGIFAEDELDITVAGNTHLEGGAIVSESGNMVLETGTLTFSDIEDHNQSSNLQGSLGVNIGIGAAGPGQPGWTVEGSYGDQTIEQLTSATIGEGEIVITNTEAQAALEEAGETENVASINRDPDLAQQITFEAENYIGVYVSDTSIAAAIEAGATILEAVEDVLRQFAVDNGVSPQDQVAMHALAQFYDDPSVLAQLETCVSGAHAGVRLNLFDLIISPAYAATYCTVSLPSGEVIALSSELVVTCVEAFENAGLFMKNSLKVVGGPLAAVLGVILSTTPAGGEEWDTTYALPDGTTIRVAGHNVDLSLRATITQPNGTVITVSMRETATGFELYGASIQGRPISSYFLPAFAADLSALTGKTVVMSQNEDDNSNVPATSPQPQTPQNPNQQVGSGPGGGGPDPYFVLELLNLAKNVENISRRLAEDVNAGYPADYQPPYTPGTEVIEFVADGSVEFVRVYGQNSLPQGGWVMLRSDIEGLTPRQIADKFALPSAPTHIVDVTPPVGTPMRVGITNPNFGRPGGGMQFEFLRIVDQGWGSGNNL